jgi:GR25 family glycosyltransferase involved in LPS biosynthesis
MNGVSTERDIATHNIKEILSDLPELDSRTINYFDVKESEGFVKKYPNFITKKLFKLGEIGVWASNYEAWDTFVKSDYDYLILFEDDAKIDPDFIEGITDYIKELPEGWDFFSPYVHWWQQNNNYNPGVHDYGHKDICKAYQVWSLACYVVSKSGAIKAIEEANKGIIDPVDWFIFQDVQRFNTYTLKPKVKQYCDINYFETTIQNEIVYPNWFVQAAESYFNKHAKEFSGKDNLKFLQIGAYTGDASVWLAEHVLTGTGSSLDDIDTWMGSEEGVHRTFDWSHLESTYNYKISIHKNISKHKMFSFDFLKTVEHDIYDFIYIDGDHTANGVYNDAINSFPALKKGGVMAFDDYLWVADSGKREDAPKDGIDKFLDEYKDSIDIIEQTYQVWVRKI